MGKHYVPQKYLSGFAAPMTPKAIWQFDKQTGEFSGNALSIKKVAQQREFYNEETEEKITRLIESPGNAVLDKLRSSEFDLSDQDRVDLAVYMATMLKRVPRNRDRGHEQAPKTLAKVTSELRDQIRAAKSEGHISSELAEQHLAEAERVSEEFAANTPQDVIEQIESPWPTEQMVQLIYEMHWRFVRTDGPNYFIASDNPAFFFECWGLKNDESELTFPISSQLALFGSWTPVRRASDRVLKGARFVKEANCRLAYGASRFIFSRSRLSWLAKVARKRVEDLNRIVW